MAGSVNKVIIVGNVGKAPETRTFQNGGKVCNFSIATSERWKDKQTGEARDKTEWHSVAVTNEHIVGVVERFVKKGMKVYVEGQLETRKWTDNNGVERYTTQVAVKPFSGSLEILEPIKADSTEPGRANINAPAASSVPTYDELDDSIPF